MKRFALIWMLLFAVVFGNVNVLYAAKTGRANLFIRLAGSTGFSNAPVQVEVGDIINIELFIEGRGEELTGVDIFLDFDDAYLELVPAQTIPRLFPFLQGPFLRGTVAKNTTLGDSPGGSGNQFPRFQMQYNEDISPTGFSGEQRAAVGDGVVATFKLRVIRKPQAFTSAVRVIRSSPTGSETGYFKKGDAGSVYGFNQIQELLFSIRGLELDVNLPDLYLLPGQVDSTLDLDDYVNDLGNPDSTLVWTNSVPIPDSVQVGINPTSHRVLVDSRVINGPDTTNFIGIAQVQFTATTRFDEDVTDNIRIVVDTPPAFVGTSPDSVIFFEDRDTTFTLVAVDPDPGARLTFLSFEHSDNITPVMGAKTVKGDTTFQSVRVSAAPDYSGQGQIRFSVVDQFARGDSTHVSVVVKPVNDPPRYIKAFPTIVIDALGQHTLVLSEYVVDPDDPFSSLQFAFTGVDSIAFDVTANNGQLIITPVTPFQGIRTANVVVTDPSTAAAIQKITVTVSPPKEPQPPRVTQKLLKIDVRAGSDATTTALDPLVTDMDTPKERLTWTRSPVSRVQVDAGALSTRQLRVSAASDSIGYRTMTLRVMDPTFLADTLQVRIYASSVTTGIPVAGGMPDITLVSGEQDTLNLDDYYFDADHANAEVMWTSTGGQGVSVNIDPNSHQAVFQTVSGVSHAVEDIIFTVTDPQGKTATDTVRVTVLDPGSVLLDMSVVGGKVDLGLRQVDTLSLREFVRIGDPNNIAWGVNSRDLSVVFAQSIGEDLLLIGVGIGTTRLVLTATDKISGKSARDSLIVNVGIQGNPDSLLVKNFGALNLTAGRDTTIDLTSVVVAGNLANLVWSVGENQNIAVEIDTLNQRALLRAPVGFIGNAGDLVFQVRDVVTGNIANSVASPVNVLRGELPSGTDLIKIEVIRNPILKNFLDVFIRAGRPLQSTPILDVRIGEDPSAARTFISVDPVTLVSRMWVGDLRLSNETTGIVELAVQGITQDTRIALLDTLRLSIEQANVRTTFNIRQDDVAVSLPSGGVDASSVVALIPERREPTRTKVATNLVPVSDTYIVYAPYAEVVRTGQIAFSLSQMPENAGIYREDVETGKWILMGREIQDGRLVGEFDTFGRYGVFVDLNPVSHFTLHQNFPNPFNPQTTIRFDLLEADQIQLTVYNALGQAVRHLASGYFASGRHVVTWDARDAFGRGVSAGVYVYQLKTTQSSITRKMLLLK